MKKVLSLVLAALLALAALMVPAMAEGDTFRIGTYFGITGGNSAYGIECRNAVRLAV